jgi:hypothetical protein
MRGPSARRAERELAPEAVSLRATPVAWRDTSIV